MDKSTQGNVQSQGTASPISATNAVADYTFAAAQLRAQLDRLNDDPLIIKLAGFLDDNRLTAQWQADAFAVSFGGFVHDVAPMSRPN
jgi:hypothetical protein